MNERLQEYADSRGLPIRVDRDRGIIHGVKILGVHSRNGRTYLAEAIEKAASLYEEAKVNVNHARPAPGGPRDYEDRIGVIRGVAPRPGEGLFGDFHFNPKHALAEQLLWDAENAPQNVGFSHNVQARTARRGDTVVVEAITQVQSVDLVADPATTRGLFESSSAEENAADDDAPRLETVTVAQLREARPDLVDELLAGAEERISRLQEENEQLRAAENDRRKRETILQLLAESDWTGTRAAGPSRAGALSESFVETLMEAEDEPAVRRLIRQRVELLRDLDGHSPGARPTSREQTRLYADQPADVKAFLRCIS